MLGERGGQKRIGSALTTTPLDPGRTALKRMTFLNISVPPQNEDAKETLRSG
jgi:hypothetical protein